MKLLYTIIFIFSAAPIFAQVGIGTTNPLADLHIAGDVLTQDYFSVDNFATVSATDEGFRLITRTTNSVPVGEIGILDVYNVSVAPINTRNYHFTNVSLDNLTDVDLQYNTDDYIVAVSNFRYVGDAIDKVPSNTTKSIGNFVVRVFESADTWHLEIKNRTLDLNIGDSVEYHITLVIYNKKYFRYLDPITTDLGGLNSGTASSIPILQ